MKTIRSLFKMLTIIVCLLFLQFKDISKNKETYIISRNHIKWKVFKLFIELGLIKNPIKLF